MKLSKQGFSLTSVIAVCAVVGVLSFSIARFFKNTTQAKRDIDQLNDLEALRQELFAQIDCEGTFKTAGVDLMSAIQCASTSLPSGQAVPFLRLRRFGFDSNALWLTDVLEADGSAKYGKWYLRASCSLTERTLVVRVSPIGQSPKDFEGRHSLLFGDPQKGLLSLCYGNLNSGWAPNCDLAASLTPINVGQTTTLTLTTAGAIKSATIDGTSVPISGGSVNRSPTATKKFHGDVVGPGGHSECEVTVDVN